jgi:hypothetical protein
VEVFTDSDWAGDKDSRKSVSGYIILLNNVPICWRSKSQAAISLSSSEAEMYALTEAVKEVPFIIQVLLFMNAKIKLPVQIRVDNMGAIYMSENSMPSARTRHADLRTKFTADLQEKGLIKIDFVKSEDNASDIMTKNVTVELFEKHISGLIMNKNEIEIDSSDDRKGVAEMSTDLPQTGSNKGPSQNNSTTRWGPQPQHICNVPNRSGHMANGTDEKHKENNANALAGSIGKGDGTNSWNGIDPFKPIGE